MSTTHTPINIYDCPTRDKDGRLPLPYMIAVMKAAGDSNPVQWHNASVRNVKPQFVWDECEPSPGWNWHMNNYRINPSSRPSVSEFKVGDWVVNLRGASLPLNSVHKIDYIIQNDGEFQHLYFGYTFTKGRDGWSATCFRPATSDEVSAHLGNQLAPGHNPHKLTVKQVGEGWRLMDREEIEARENHPWRLLMTESAIQRWYGDGNMWVSPMKGTRTDQTYRTTLSRAQMAALIAPKPKKKVPMTAADYPSVFWVRNWTASTEYLVVHIRIDGSIGVPSTSGKIDVIDPEWAMDNLEYSTDRKTWRPCYKEIDA